MNALRGASLSSDPPAASFLVDTTLHLRYKRLGEDKLHLVKSLSFTGGVLLVQWTQEADTQGLPPAVSQEVEIYVIKQGVLYISQGTVIELRPGGRLRLSIKVAAQARRVCLRRHQRYVVRGQLRLGPVDGEFTYEQPSDQEMDVSLGGFGCRLPKTALANPDLIVYPGEITGADGDGELPQTAVAMRARINLEVFAENRGRINPNLPSITLHCCVDIRRRIEVEGTGDCNVGFQFLDIRSEELETLKLWLSAHSVHLREC